MGAGGDRAADRGAWVTAHCCCISATPRGAAAHLSASLADAEASNAALQSAIATQNSAVAEMRAELEQGVRAAAARERAATAVGTAAMRTAASGARALEGARIDAGCAAAIRMGQRAGGGAWPMVMRNCGTANLRLLTRLCRLSPRPHGLRERVWVRAH